MHSCYNLTPATLSSDTCRSEVSAHTHLLRQTHAHLRPQVLQTHLMINYKLSKCIYMLSPCLEFYVRSSALLSTASKMNRRIVSSKQDAQQHCEQQTRCTAALQKPTASLAGAPWPACCSLMTALVFSCLPRWWLSWFLGSSCLPANHRVAVAGSSSSLACCTKRMQLCWFNQVCAGFGTRAGQTPDDSASTAEGVACQQSRPQHRKPPGI